MWLNIELPSIRSWIQNFLTSKPVTYANLNFSIPNSNLRAVLNQNKFERIQNKLLFAQFSTRHILPTQTTQICGGRIRNEVFSFYIFDKLHYMHPPLFFSPLTFPIVEVNLTIYMFLESIGSSVCIQYQQRYIFLSSTSSSFLLSNNKMNYTINSK